MTSPNLPKSNTKLKIQRFGSYLSGMVMPNIGAFIAWGIITALFIPTGWFPNEDLAKFVEPMITYLLPILIGFTGGRIIYDLRGGVIGATATMGLIVGSDIPMLLGAMIMGPIGGWLIKKFDKSIEGKVRSGFEMLVNNFSAGIIAVLLTLLAYKGIGPIVLTLNKTLAAGVQTIVEENLLPLASIFIEPAKVLFLNNAINHGILSPIGIDQASRTGKSILFLLESNPGPGLGILLAYTLFGKGKAKQSAPGAAIIQFLGGVHEIYFPYILMKPFLLVAAIVGGATGVFTFIIFDAGLVAAPSPGSIFALVAMTPRGSYLGTLAGVLTATVVSFLISAVILKTSKQTDEEDLDKATEKTTELKGKERKASTVVKKEKPQEQVTVKENNLQNYLMKNVSKIIFACDAGMGSSAMGASILKNKVQKAGLNIAVSNTSINNLPTDADIVITHQDLTDRAKAKLPDTTHISVDNFLNSPKYDELLALLKNENTMALKDEVKESPEYHNVSKIIFACDAGMGSSAMGASILKNKVQKAGLNVTVSNTSINTLPADANIVITHKDLTDRAKTKLPNTHHISVENFLNSSRYDELIEKIKNKENMELNLLKKENVNR
ncbi:TPA: PTS mannitol transporter subunit IICBA [Bacillus cereus]|nr:PTS mannitol transporter subunit IICBA [Bacillus cereus]